MSNRTGLGIIGGVGPLASAEFLKTIYDQCQGLREQEMPRVFMWSDPSFPERIQTQSGNFDAEILIQLRKALRDLDRLEVSSVLICCITIHHLIPKLPSKCRKKILSLVDVIFSKLTQSGEPNIVLCSTRTSSVQLFQRHPGWPAVGRFMIFPEEEEQRLVQNFINRLKLNHPPNAVKALLDRFVKKYRTQRFICGCTEMHLVAKYFQSDSLAKPRYTFLDPLMIVAKSLVSAKTG